MLLEFGWLRLLNCGGFTFFHRLGSNWRITRVRISDRDFLRGARLVALIVVLLQSQFCVDALKVLMDLLSAITAISTIPGVVVRRCLVQIYVAMEGRLHCPWVKLY